MTVPRRRRNASRVAVRDSTAGWWLSLAGVVVVVVVAVVALGGGGAAVLNRLVGREDAEEQAVLERRDVSVLGCSLDRNHILARILVENHSSERSSYFIDVEYVRPQGGRPFEVSQLEVASLRPGHRVRRSVEATRQAPPAYDCRIGDVDRMSAARGR